MDLQGMLGQALSAAWRIEAVRLAATVVGCVLLVKLSYAVYRRRRLAAAGIDRIDTMSGLEFEQYLEYLFRRLGYRVERTRYSGDFGADLVVARKDERRVVQAKRKAGRVGVAAVQQAVAARAMYDCDTAMVVTNGSFTAQAEALAAANDVELWDRERLVAEVLQAASSRRSSVQEERDAEVDSSLSPLETPSPNQDRAEPTPVSAVCRACGRGVTEAARAYCLANAGRFGGHVYCHAHQSRATAARSRVEKAARRRPEQ